MSSPTVDHLRGVNEFFIRLLVHARHYDGTRLARWWAERTGSTARQPNSPGHDAFRPPAP